MTTEEGKPYIELIKYIDEDKFWKAQIAQISVDKKGEMTMYTQVGGEVIVFGKPEEIEVKFKKLTAYYKEVIPVKGFNRYKTVNLKFKDQIVCE